MKILIIGSGGREHALVWTLLRTSSRPVKLFCAPGNACIAQIAECVRISGTDIAVLAAFVEKERIDSTIVGPEAPLAAGVVDDFSRRGLRIIGPDAKAARLESSKAFAKDFMGRHGIPTARYRTALSADEAVAILKSGEFWNEDATVVVKADCLDAGKS